MIYLKKTMFFVFVPLAIICMIQICLITPQTRELFTRIEEIENVRVEDDVPKVAAYVELSLTKGKPSNDIIVYFNANEVARFNYPVLTLRLDCDGVLQIKNGNNENIIVAAKCNLPHKIEQTNTQIPNGLFALGTFTMAE